MARIKRNQKNTKRNTEGYIKKYFGSDISSILIPSSKSLQNCPIPYVRHEEAELVLGDFLKGDRQRDKSIAFTGLKGSGKTTILRHVFDIEGNSNQSKICGKTVTISIDFNRSQISAQEAILSSIRSAVEKICRRYNIVEPDIYNEQFYEFVERTRSDFLNADKKRNRNTTHPERLDKFLDSAAVPYASCQLQYVLSSSLCDIELVILIVDNVEGYSRTETDESKYFQPVIEALHLYDCISQREQPTKWCFNLVIACRHYIWRLIQGLEDENGIEVPLLESFITNDNCYDLREPVAINSIVEVREQILSRYHNTERWNTSVGVIKEILAKMEGTLGDFILQLRLKDFRKSFVDIQSLILHSDLQKASEDEINNAPGAFQIDSPDQFDLSRINLIRTLAIGNNSHYLGTGPIPNLMFNNKEEYLELYPLLTIKYFLKKCGYVEPSWDNSVSVESFYRSMKDLFGFNDNHIQKVFMESVSYFIKHRMLLRSADQQQDEVPGLKSEEEIKKIEKVYVSGAAVMLWKELYNSSALFQLYLDDIYVEKESDYLKPHGNDIEHCFDYLKYLRTKEVRIFNMVANQSKEKIRQYIDCFGNHSICEYLAHGLLNSLEYIVAHDSSKRAMKAKRTKKKIKGFIAGLKTWDSRL